MERLRPQQEEGMILVIQPKGSRERRSTLSLPFPCEMRLTVTHDTTKLVLGSNPALCSLGHLLSLPRPQFSLLRNGILITVLGIFHCAQSRTYRMCSQEAGSQEHPLAAWGLQTPPPHPDPQLQTLSTFPASLPIPLAAPCQASV